MKDEETELLPRYVLPSVAFEMMLRGVLGHYFDGAVVFSWIIVQDIDTSLPPLYIFLSSGVSYSPIESTCAVCYSHGTRGLPCVPPGSTLSEAITLPGL